MTRFAVRTSLALALAGMPQAAAAQPADPPPRPWLLVPLVSSSPKLGTSGGALVGYARRLDPESRVSLFGVIYQYTSTHSSIGALFARTSFGADHHRIAGVGSAGAIKNDYQRAARQSPTPAEAYAVRERVHKRVRCHDGAGRQRTFMTRRLRPSRSFTG